MEKKNKIYLITLILLTVCVVGICIYSIIKNRDLKDSDALKFRNEYMELNGEESSGGKIYPNVTISEKNTVKYINEKEAVELLESGKGIIYFGFSTCPWCRSMISSLTKIAEEKHEKIYYLDVLNIRSRFEVKDGELTKVNEGTKGYYEILDKLSDYLNDFILTDESGNKYDTGEKRLYAPTLVAFNGGRVTDFHVGTVESQKTGYDKLTVDEIEELEKIITNLIDSKVDVCTNSDKC